MPLKYLDASPYLGKTPKQLYISQFEEFLTREFYNSSDWHTIQEQSAIGSDTYNNIDVRITHAVSNEYGIIQNDDYKIILFKELDHVVKIGQFYQFDNNYWVVVNTEGIKSLTQSCGVRRCNNMLRWLDTDGSLYQVPCAITELIKENRDYATAGSALVSPSGILDFTTQLNAKTNRIRPNQRFLIGNNLSGFPNWTAWKVQGGGINNYNNLQTANNSSATLLRLTMVVNYTNEDTDDLINGIGDIYQYAYTLALDKVSVAGNPTNTFQLTPTVKLNGETVTRNVTWTTGSSSIATVSLSGLVTAVANGTTTIRASMTNNPAVYADCAIAVSAVAPTPVARVVVSPNKNYILQGQTQTYTANLYLDDTVQADTFTFSVVDTGVPTDHYTFLATDGNHFAISNLEMYLNADLRIRCVSGVNTLNYDIKLKGAW